MSNFFHGKMFAKISELDETIEFDTADEFVVVNDHITQKITGLNLTESIVAIGNLASKVYVDAVVSAVVDGAPALLDTLNELAAALNDDANFATTITALIGTKLASNDFNSYFDTALSAKTTSSLTEGTKLFYTQARFDSALAAKTTTALAEGINLYFTEQRVLDIIAEQPTNRLVNGSFEVTLNVDGTLTLPADPTSDSHAATKGYVDNQITDVVAGQGFATLDYVEDAIALALSTASITGASVDFGGGDSDTGNGSGSSGGGSGGVTSYNDLTDKPTLFQIGIKEPIASRTAATGVVDHDMATANIFNHSNLAGNFTCNVTNLSLPTNNAINVTLVINQGVTPYMPTAFQIGGVAQTINWLNGIEPAGSASKIDVASFSILNNSGTYTVLGSLSTFG